MDGSKKRSRPYRAAKRVSQLIRTGLRLLFRGATLHRITVANNQIAPLQDAVDLDMATDEEVRLLNAWKKYRVLVNRIDTNKAPDIQWPPQPQ